MADSVIQALVGKLVEYSADAIKKQVRYLCCYSCNVQTLEAEVEELNFKHQGLQQLVNLALANSEAITPEVESWLKKVEDLKTRSATICSDAEEVKRSCVCKRFPVLHYCLSRNALKTTNDSVQLRNIEFPIISTPVIPADIPPVPTTSIAGFESRVSIEDKIMNALKDPSVYSLGIWGIGGVGKTVMAKEIEKRVRDEKVFERVVMVVVSQQPDLPKIQSQIANDLGLKFNEDSPISRQKKLHQRLMAEKGILIILDDIWDKLNMEEIGIPSQSTHAGCKLILTSRNKDALTSTGVPGQNIFQLKILTDEESWGFFKDNAGINADDDSHDELVQIAKKVERECMGLPLALKIVACALKGEDNISVWNNAVQELKKHAPENIQGVAEEVYGSLLFSFNALKGQGQKDLFLLCCLFPEDYIISIEELLRCVMGLGIFKELENLTEARNKVETVLKILLFRSLLIEGNKKRGNFNVGMHDVIRDVGIWIATKGIDQHLFLIKHGVDKWPTVEGNSSCHYTCISLLFSHRKIIFPESIVFPKLEFLRLEFVWEYSKDNYVELPENFFNGMSGLRFFEAFDIRLLLPSMCRLNNLRTLSLHHCKICESTSVLGKLTNLEMLSLRYCTFEVLPAEIGGLKNLEQMNISSCRSQLLINEQLNLSNLQKVEIKECDNLLYLFSLSVVQSLMQLSDLKVKNCRTIKEIFKREDGELEEINEIKFPKLRKIEFVGLDSFYGLCSEIDRIELPELHELYIDDLPRMKMAEGDSNEVHQKYLFSKVDNVQVTWISINFCVLQILRLNGIGNFKCIFSPSVIISGLPNLINLIINDCSMLEEAIGKDNENVGREIIFPNLKHLKLKNLPNIRTFCYNAIQFPSLKELEVHKCPLMLKFVEGLTDDISSSRPFLNNQVDNVPVKGISINFCVLQNLTLNGIGNFKCMFSPSVIISGLPNLRSLFISDCSMLEEVIGKNNENVGREIIFPNLTHIFLSNLPNIRTFCYNAIQFPSLEWSVVRECPLMLKFVDGLTEDISSSKPFLDKQVQCPKLEELSLDGLNISGVFSPLFFKSLTILKKLDLRDCKELEHVITKEEGPTTSNTEEDFIQKIPLERFSLIRMPKLCGSIFQIKHNLEFPLLEEIKIEDCPMLEKFFLRSLRMSKLKSVIGLLNNEHVDNFFSDQKVDNVQVTWISINFCVLRELTMSGIGNFKCMFSPSVIISELPYLSKLSISDCSMLEQVIGKDNENIGRAIIFPNLIHLKLRKLPNIRTFCYNAIQFPSLKKLHVEECPLMLKFVEGLTDDISSSKPFLDKQVQCPKLESLTLNGLNISGAFSPLFFKSLTVLKYLDLRYCEELEHMITKEEGPTTTNTEEESIEKIPLLRFTLIQMPKLCGSIFPIKPNLEFPLLEYIIIEDCPKLEKFSLGSVQLPKLYRECRLSITKWAPKFFSNKEEEEEEEEEEEQARKQESIEKQKDVALDEITTPTAKEALRTKAKTLDKHEQLCELSKALAVLASASSVSREREEFLGLVKKEIELYNSMVDKEGTIGEEEARKAYKAAREDSDQAVERALGDKVSSALIDRVDAMLQKLEKEIDDVDATIGDRWRLLDRDYDGKVTPEEVASAATYLKDTLGKDGIEQLISKLSKDKEGKILVEDIVKLGSQTEVEEEEGDAETAEAGKAQGTSQAK